MNQANHEGSTILCFFGLFFETNIGGPGSWWMLSFHKIEWMSLQFKFNITRLVSQDP